MTSPETPEGDRPSPADSYVCPECLTGKHGNCDGGAWCIPSDEEVDCRCDLAKHFRQPLDLTAQDEADLALIAADADSATSANPDERVISMVQPITAVDEVIGGGNGIAAHLGNMLGQLGAHLLDADLDADFAHFSVYGVRSTEPAIEASTRNIIPIGTLSLVMSIRVKPADR